MPLDWGPMNMNSWHADRTVREAFDFLVDYSPEHTFDLVRYIRDGGDIILRPDPQMRGFTINPVSSRDAGRGCLTITRIIEIARQHGVAPPPAPAGRCG